LSSVRCVVFDIDDTLYLERDYVQSGFAAVGRLVAERFGASGFAAKAWELFERGVRGTTFDEALRQCGASTSADEIAELVSVYRSHLPAIRLLRDAAKCLDALAGRRTLAAISDGPLESQRGKALALGLEHWCEPIVLTATLGAGRGKPHPAAFEHVQQATGFRAEQCMYVADNPAKDFQGPRSLGWRTVRIRRPLGLHFHVEEPVNWDAAMEDLANLPDMLRLDASPEGKAGL
jgi:putative hydrolase of the HAD superfamily